MAEKSDKGAPEDPTFKKVVQHFLNTPPKPHKPKPPKSRGDKAKGGSNK